MSKSKRGLGRGLDALLGSATADAGSTSSESTGFDSAERIRMLPIEQIQPGRYQPRTGMDREKLEELAASIRVHGIVQPIVVRPIGLDRFELIAGERRWRAAQLASLRDVPAIVRDIPDQATVAIALIENIQREDLSPLEEAQALKRLIDEFDLTHAQAAEAVGRSRTAISNLLRLLELTGPVRTLLDERKLEMGHARALLTLPEDLQKRLALAAVAEGWSVRQMEAEVRRAQAPAKALPTSRAGAKDPDISRLERELGERIGAAVQIDHARGRGKLVINYHSLDALEGILARIR